MMLDEANKKSGYNKQQSAKTEPKKRQAKSKSEKVNKFGVKVGDVFHMSWGYDQTNNDFFQVIALVGESSVRIREVDLDFTSSGIGFMSENRTFKIPQNGELAARHERSIWIKDQENGDIKRLNSYSGDGTTNPYIKIENHHASKCCGKTCTAYESWYA